MMFGFSLGHWLIALAVIAAVVLLVILLTRRG